MAACRNLLPLPKRCCQTHALQGEHGRQQQRQEFSFRQQAPKTVGFYGISADAEREEDVSQSRCRHDQAFCTLAQFFLIHNALSYSGHACAAAVQSLAGNEKSSILGIW